MESDPDNFNPINIPDPHLAAGLLMLYLRMLPESVILPGITQRVLTIHPDTYPVALPQLLSPEELPPSHRHLLRKILAMLHDVSKCEKSSMTSKSIAICVSPSLFGLTSPASGNIDTVGSRIQTLTMAMTWLVENYRIALPSASKRVKIEDGDELHSIGGESEESAAGRRRSRLILASASPHFNPLDLSMSEVEPSREPAAGEGHGSSVNPLLPAAWSAIVESQVLPIPDSFLISEFDFAPEAQYEVKVEQGDIIALFEMDPSGWCLGRVIVPASSTAGLDLDLPTLSGLASSATLPIGLFPSTYCTPLVLRDCSSGSEPNSLANTSRTVLSIDISPRTLAPQGVSPRSDKATSAPTTPVNAPLAPFPAVHITAEVPAAAPPVMDKAALDRRIAELEREIQHLKAMPSGGGLSFLYAALVGILVALATNVYLSFSRK